MKEYLSQKGVQYTARDVSVDQSAGEESYRVSGQTGIPVTVIDGEVIVGFDRKRIDDVLAAAGAAGGGAAQSAGRRPFGLRIADASRITREKGMTPLFGAYVDRVARGSAAERAGLLAGDIITEVNMRPVGGASDLEKVLVSAPAGARLSFMFLRGRERGKTEAVV